MAPRCINEQGRSWKEPRTMNIIWNEHARKSDLILKNDRTYKKNGMTWRTKGRKLKWQESKMKGTWKEDQKEKETNRKGNFMSWAYQIGSWKIQKLLLMLQLNTLSTSLYIGMVDGNRRNMEGSDLYPDSGSTLQEALKGYLWLSDTHFFEACFYMSVRLVVLPGFTHGIFWSVLVTKVMHSEYSICEDLDMACRDNERIWIWIDNGRTWK